MYDVSLMEGDDQAEWVSLSPHVHEVLVIEGRSRGYETIARMADYYVDATYLKGELAVFKHELSALRESLPSNSILAPILPKLVELVDRAIALPAATIMGIAD